MPTQSTNRIVINLNKVAYAKFFWRNQWGDTSPKKPTTLTVHLSPFDIHERAPFNPKFPDESMYGRAMRLGMLDIWMPVIRFRCSAADVVEFTGQKALALNKTWNAKIYGK